jgi:hypothetical protein
MCHLTHLGATTLPTLQTLPCYRSAGVLRSRLHLTLDVDNEAGLAWLEDALAYAFTQRRPELWAYLEAVMDDVLFEMELSAS